MRKIVLLCLASFLIPALAQAQLWRDVLSANQPGAADYQSMPTEIDTSTWTHCPNSPVSASNFPNINTIISSCDTSSGGKKVVIGPGVINTSLQIRIQDKSNFLLEGAGEFTGGTEIVASGTDGCTGFGITAICIVSGVPGSGWPSAMGGTPGVSPNDGLPRKVNIIAGATWKSTAVTVALTDGNNGQYAAGDYVIINQLTESNPTTYEPQINCNDGNNLPCLGEASRQIQQPNVISAVNCTTVCVLTLEQPLHYPDWKQSLSPQIYTYQNIYATSNRRAARNVVIRHLKITPAWCAFNTCGSSALSYGSIQVQRMNGVLIERVMINGCDSGCISANEAIKVTVRHSYFYNSRGAESHNVSSTYGIVGNVTTALVAYNNILHKIQAPFTYNGWVNGSVIAYNYTRNQVAALCPIVNGCPPNPWTFPYNWHSMWISHAGGMNTILLEGNDVNSLITEANEGNGCCYVFFRNRLSGKEPNNGVTNNFRYTTVFDLQIKSGRFASVIGNVLGTTGYHNNYESSDAAHGRKGIVGQGGFTGESAIYRNSQRGGSGETTSPYPNYDPIVDQSIYRWGNWDSFTNAIRWCGGPSNSGWSTNCGKGQNIGTPSTEVPAGNATFNQFVPVGESLPNSFVFSSKPIWFGANPWPSIGPGVTLGSNALSGYGNLVNKIPARICAESLGMFDDGTNAALNFNADTCYGTGGSSPDTTPPAAPTGVTIQ